MGIVCIVGLPGSGKTTLAREYVASGYVHLADIGRGHDWDGKAVALRERAAAGVNVIADDILLCCQTPADVARGLRFHDLPRPVFRGRDHFAKAVGLPIEWVFFGNHLANCVRNIADRRDRLNEPDDVFRFTLAMAVALSEVYRPPATARPVPHYGLTAD